MVESRKGAERGANGWQLHRGRHRAVAARLAVPEPRLAVVSWAPEHRAQGLDPARAPGDRRTAPTLTCRCFGQEVPASRRRIGGAAAQTVSVARLGSTRQLEADLSADAASASTTQLGADQARPEEGLDGRSDHARSADASDRIMGSMSSDESPAPAQLRSVQRSRSADLSSGWPRPQTRPGLAGMAHRRLRAPTTAGGRVTGAHAWVRAE